MNKELINYWCDFFTPFFVLLIIFLCYNKVRLAGDIMGQIDVIDFTKDYGFNRGCFDVSFSINKGEIFGFLGPNGAGKSTTIRHLMGFSKPDKGKCLVLEKNAFDNANELMKKVGYLPGEICLPSGLNGQQFINMIAKMKGVKDGEFINSLINMFEVNTRCDTKSMSLGEKRKLAIVACFMSNPDIYILDEPTSGLDIKTQSVFVNYLKEEKAKGKTILLSSHIFSEVDQTCDRIAIIKDGRIVSIFNRSDLNRGSSFLYKVTFKTEKGKYTFIQNNKDVKNFTINNDYGLDVNILVDKKDVPLMCEILSKYKLSFFEYKELSLEDYFMKYYKEDRVYNGVK